MSAPLKVTRMISSCYRKSATQNGLLLSKSCCCHLQRGSQTAAEVKPRTWQLHSAVCLQRYPVISTTRNQFEQKYKDYLDEVEVNQSLLSDHELQMISDRLRKEKKKPDTEEEIKKKIVVEESLQTAEEMEDDWQKELEAFQFADRITDADRSNDMTTPNRKLDKRLVLITKQRWGEGTEPYWVFPQVLRLDGETMREAAERALKSHCGESVNATYIGNAPCGYHRYKLPPGQDDFGVKLFFFKAYYHGGEVALQTDNVVEYKWVTIDEMQDYLDPPYLDNIQDFLIDL
ncbi:39S ribosomal protein L46, mitochondrial-like [Mercenaria mercenaria]|uniref:39S ribosomal protein L46, mitochondrial-like n=1 Tax=Mercenaria mercenaria TaxID=6596 RepID=UPI001E1D64E1|nr:39S ribosomal protein L46, mitochondrial-like [Mercenaria mercenaria]